jgi:hypothetical protein
MARTAANTHLNFAGLFEHVRTQVGVLDSRAGHEVRVVPDRAPEHREG